MRYGPNVINDPIMKERGMTFDEFHNGLRILESIDRHELVVAGVFEDEADEEWAAFLKSPHRWMIEASDEQATKLWALMVGRGAIKREAA